MAEKLPEKLGFEFLAGKSKGRLLAIMGSILNFWQCLDDERTSEIQKIYQFGVYWGDLEISVFLPQKTPKFPNIQNIIFHRKNKFILNLASLPTIQVP